jgi:hypothetical protein
MEQLEQEVIAWHRATFPNATEQAVVEKCGEEINEWLETTNSEAPAKEYWNEFADVIITHMAYIAKTSNGEVTLADIVRLKFDEVKARTWGKELPNGDRKKEKLFRRGSEKPYRSGQTTKTTQPILRAMEQPYKHDYSGKVEL